MNLRTLILILAAIHIFTNPTAAREIRFQQLGFEDGFSQINIRSLWQDELGCIWIGTNEGITRYNGSNFDNIHIFPDKNSGYPSAVNVICGDYDGHLYIYLRTNANYIFEYDLRSGGYKQIYEDSKGFVQMCYSSGKLWFSSDNNIYTYQNGKVDLYHSVSADNVRITAMIESSDNVLYIGTHASGIYRLGPQKQEESILPVKSRIVDIFEDQSDRIWVGSQSDGLFVLNPDGTIQQYTSRMGEGRSVSNDDVRAICEDDQGYIWIGTISGLDRLNPQTRQITHYGKSGQKDHNLSHPAIYDLFKDDLGNIWVGTYYGGINYFNPRVDFFDFYDFANAITTSGYLIVSCIVEDNHGHFWIGTEGTGLMCIDKDKQIIRHYKKGENSVSGNIIKSLYFDAALEKLWIGIHYGGLNILDLKTGKFEYHSIGKEKGNFPIQSIQSIIPFDDYYFLGTLAGVYRYYESTGKTVPIKTVNDKATTVFDLQIDSRRNLWIASNGVYRYNVDSDELDTFHNIIQYTNASPLTVVNRLLPDSKDRIWIATAGAGVIMLDPSTNEYVEFNQLNSGLESNYVSCIYESAKGSLIVGTHSGLSFINEDLHGCFNYNIHNGFPLLSMMSGVIRKCKSGELIIGGINGICLFDEVALMNTRQEIKLHFDKLWINNKLINPGDGTKILKHTLAYTDKIRLAHNHKNFTVHIASNNYVKRDLSDFKYKLEPFDKEWKELKPGNQIGYMNLRAGNYKLKVQRYTMFGPDKNGEISLDIVVRPPMYATSYAIAAYILLFVLISYLVISFFRSKLLLQASLVYERKDKERIEKLNQSKLRFFTYVSHEFRTPITLIINHLELLEKSVKSLPEHHNEVAVAYRNAQKLVGLINELLDFKKQEQGFLYLTVAPDNIVKFVHDIYASFISYSESKQVRITFTSDEEQIKIFFDSEQLLKVFNNLLSNALKYTKRNDTIDITVRDNTDSVTVSVKDSGIGIPEEVVDSIFNHFYQVSNGPNENVVGSGLGLAISKGIVELHHGKIEVKSELQMGTEFIVTLLKGGSHFENDDRVRILHTNRNRISTIIDSDTVAPSPEENERDTNELSAGEPVILIVEDDADLRNLLKRILSSMYHVIEASNGLEGYEMARENYPDLILSDILMPEMNGNQMCMKLKSNFETCHIPIILLTTQSTVEQNIEGLKSGADDYISKPFNSTLLIVRCSNLLNNRRILQEKYSKEIDSSPRIIASNPEDEQFVEKAVQIIKDNVMTKTVNIDFLCSEMCIGRRLFFTKMKSITGQTPNDFILTVKYKMAATMLKEQPKMYIAEISDVLRFSSYKYFRKGFKEHFGVSPTEMRKNLNPENNRAD